MDLTVFTGPIADIVLAAVAAAFATLIPVALKWFYSKTKLDQLVSDDVVREYLYDVLDRGIALAKVKVAEQKLTVNVDNVIGSFVYEYLKNFVPDALDHFGLNESKVADMVRSRIANVTK
jgi:hypothetical protein